jgi:hypothetical protein
MQNRNKSNFIQSIIALTMQLAYIPKNVTIELMVNAYET